MRSSSLRKPLALAGTALAAGRRHETDTPAVQRTEQSGPAPVKAA